MVVITGANSGIGAAVLQMFAEAGTITIACSRIINDGQMHQWSEIANATGSKIIPCQLDLSTDGQWKQSLQSALCQAGEPDILINNAGVAHGGYLQMTSVSKLKEIFDVNYFCQLALIQVVAKVMCRRKSGSIVNITSIAGLDPKEGNCGYGASKAAFGYATSVLAKEYAAHGVRVNAVAPGLTQTRMADLMESKARANMVNSTAFKRLATPAEIASAVVFLASTSSGFITGQVLRVDGGT